MAFYQGGMSECLLVLLDRVSCNAVAFYQGEMSERLLVLLERVSCNAVAFYQGEMSECLLVLLDRVSCNAVAFYQGEMSECLLVLLDRVSCSGLINPMECKTLPNGSSREDTTQCAGIKSSGNTALNLYYVNETGLMQWL